MTTTIKKIKSYTNFHTQSLIEDDIVKIVKIKWFRDPQ